MSEEAFWISIVLGLGLIIGGTIFGCTAVYQHTQQKAFENGYVEVENRGASGTHWEKSK